ncbi:MAG: toll/interleukin-1 receptor domain-containing protein [Verrucomicrobia bacterium]|nr:toll/interleukin-1 receptor domain-containing protein [Verrucomicrobiota bacterium]
MYLAQFESEHGTLVAASCRWSGAKVPSVSAQLSSLLFQHPVPDLAVRLQNNAGARSLTLIASAPVGDSAAVTQLLSAVTAAAPEGLTLAGSAQEFDRITTDFPAHHLRLDTRSYHHGGQPLACGFQLHPFFRWIDEHQLGAWQGHFRHQRTTEDVERRTRHYLSRLQLEKPFSDRVRQLQELLAARCLAPGWLGEEFLALNSTSALTDTQKHLQDHFTETFGRMGFTESPLVAEDADEWLSSGLHPARLENTLPSPNILGASWFDSAQLTSLLTTAWHTPAAARPSGTAPIFISYASADYSTAEKICSILEQQGRRCWLAPRDINNSLLPYPVAIETAIGTACAVVVVMSSAANLSVHIPREVDLAIERRLPIIPLRIQDILPAGQLNYLLRTCQWVEAHHRDIQDAIAEIRVRLGSAS